MFFMLLIFIKKLIHSRTSYVMKAYLICHEAVPHMSPKRTSCVMKAYLICHEAVPHMSPKRTSCVITIPGS